MSRHIANFDNKKNNSEKRSTRPHLEPKFYGWDGTHTLSAGGLIPYDSNGFWCVVEQNNEDPTNTKLTDVGGKYRFEDIDIDGCIAREWNEETYYIAELRRRDVQNLRQKQRTKSSYIMTDRGDRPTYLCLFVHIDDLNEITGTTETQPLSNPLVFENARKSALSLNKRVPHYFYKTLELKYIKFDQIDELHKTSDIKWGFRLNKLITVLKGVENRKYSQLPYN